MIMMMTIGHTGTWLGLCNKSKRFRQFAKTVSDDCSLFNRECDCVLNDVHKNSKLNKIKYDSQINKQGLKGT